MGKNKGKEVAVKQSTEVSNDLAGAFDGSLASSGDTMDAKDLRIPKLTLIQQMTKQSFNTEKAAVGNYIDSIEKLDMGNSIDLFVMNDTKLWELKYLPKGAKNAEYLGTIDYTLDNQDLRDCPRIPAELMKRAEEKGVDVAQLKDGQINMVNRFYVLSVKEVMEGTPFPYIIDFKRASYPAGVQLKNSFFKMKKVQGLPSYARVFTLTSEFVQDEYEYYIKTVSAGRMIEKKEIQAVEGWVREMMTNKDSYQDDESVEEDYVQEAEVVEPETTSSTAGQPRF